MSQHKNGEIHVESDDRNNVAEGDLNCSQQTRQVDKAVVNSSGLYFRGTDRNLVELFLVELVN